MVLFAIVTWLAMTGVAIVNGIVRESVLLPRLGPAKAHVASTFLLCALLLAVTWLGIPWIAPRSAGQAFAVGACWLLATLAFEFGFGRLVAKKSWESLLVDYDLAAGRIWPLVLLTVLIAPWAVARLRGLL